MQENHPTQTGSGGHVALRWTGVTTAEVVISVHCDDDCQDEAVALSRAWTALAEAISLRKAESTASAEQHPPGSGGWWEG